MKYLPADNVILGSSSFIPKIIQEEREHKSQISSQGRVASYSSADVESPLIHKSCLGWLKKGEFQAKSITLQNTRASKWMPLKKSLGEKQNEKHICGDVMDQIPCSRCTSTNVSWAVLMPMWRNPIRHAAPMQGKYILSNIQHSIITSRPFLICHNVLENIPWKG